MWRRKWTSEAIANRHLEEAKKQTKIIKMHNIRGRQDGTDHCALLRTASLKTIA